MVPMVRRVDPGQGSAMTMVYESPDGPDGSLSWFRSKIRYGDGLDAPRGVHGEGVGGVCCVRASKAPTLVRVMCCQRTALFL